MNYYKKLFFLQMIILITVTIINLYYNIKYDLYGVFGNKNKILAYYDSFNLRVYKTNELINLKDKYDSFLIGGSRFLAFDEKQFEAKAGGKFYNFCGIRSDMYDNYIQIEFLINNFSVKNIVLQIGVDDIFYFGDNSQNILRKSHYLMTGENKYLYYFKFLFSFDMINLIKNEVVEKYIIKNYKEETYKNNFYLHEFNEDKISKNKEEFFLTEFNNRKKKNILLHPGEKIEKNIEYLKKIVEISEKNNVNLLVFTAPLYIEYLESLDQDAVKKYFENLGKITSYWNFTTINSITTNNQNFYEYIHYRKLVADLIIERIYSDKNIIFPDDFGIFVKKEIE